MVPCLSDKQRSRTVFGCWNRCGTLAAVPLLLGSHQEVATASGAELFGAVIPAGRRRSLAYFARRMQWRERFERSWGFEAKASTLKPALWRSLVNLGAGSESQ